MGDSVTDCGRNYDANPAGWGSFGDGYANLVNSFLTAFYPEREIMVVNKGVSGDDIVRMAQRWDTDLMANHPQWVSIMIGVNDVWRHFDANFQHPEMVTLEKFEQTYRELIAKTQKETANIIIMAPFMMEANRQDPMRLEIEAFARVGKKLAAENDLIYIDTQARIDAFLEKQSSYILTSDRVHPNVTGHMLLAKTWLDGVDFEWS